MQEMSKKKGGTGTTLSTVHSPFCLDDAWAVRAEVHDSVGMYNGTGSTAYSQERSGTPAKAAEFEREWQAHAGLERRSPA